MITTACEHLQEEIALKLLLEMDKSWCKLDLRTYAPLLKMFCRKKRMKVLSFLLKHMFENDVSLELGTYLLLVRGLCKCGKVEHACLFFEEMVSRGFVLKDCTSGLLKKELERKGMVKAKARVDELILQAISQRKCSCHCWCYLNSDSDGSFRLSSMAFNHVTDCWNGQRQLLNLFFFRG